MAAERGKSGYLLLDSQGGALARGILESPPDLPTMQVRVIGDKIEEVMAHEDLRLIAIAEGAPNLLGRIVRRRGDVIVLEKLMLLGAEVRQNLRVPLRFDSYIYPLSGAWKGRRPVELNDLSCGGTSFFCGEELHEGEIMEVVVPTTEAPLVLKCKVLRQRPSGEDDPMYAAAFVEMSDDEERLVREAVFSIQLRGYIGVR